MMTTTTAGASLRGREFAGTRDTLRVLPGPLQLPLTYLTGKPYTGQRGPRVGPTFHLLTAVASLLAGVALSAVGWFSRPASGLLLLLPGWAVTLHGMRNLRMMIFHQCAHQNMWGVARRDRVVGRIVAGLLIVQDFESYRREHVSDHHAVRHMTLEDPTVQAFLVSLGLRPGMSVRRMWRRVLGRICSPVFHLRFAWARLQSYLHAASPIERALAAACYLTLAAGLVASGTGVFFLVAWLLPLLLFFQVSNVLRLCVKHTFPPAGAEARRGRAYFAGLTNAIFLGEPAVPRDLAPIRRTWGWVRWTARMLFVHFPVRFLVLTGDTVCHDFHHRYPMSRDWANYIFARQRDVEAGHPGWPPYREVWGLTAAITLVFESLARADPAEYDVARLAAVSGRGLFAAFDD